MNKDLTVKVCIDGETTTYEDCDRDFIIDLLMCPCCVGKEYSITAWNKAFAENRKNKEMRARKRYDCFINRGGMKIAITDIGWSETYETLCRVLASEEGTDFTVKVLKDKDAKQANL